MGHALWVAVHRWLGLAVAGFVLVAGLTGAPLAFYHELDAAISPHLLHAAPPGPGVAPIDPLVLRERVEAALPGARIDELSLSPPEHAAHFYVSASGGAAELPFDEVFVDPWTGEIRGTRRWGDLREGLVNLVPFVFRLHYSLGLGEIGSLLFGVAALLWTVDCFVGAWITLPPRQPTGRRTPRAWLRRWLPAWFVRAHQPFALAFTGHRAAGLWLWGLLLVFAWSAVGLNLPQVYEPVTHALLGFEGRYHQLPEPPDGPRPDPTLSWAEARARGRAAMAGEAAARGFTVLAERRMNYDAEHAAWRYQVRSTLDVSNRYPETTVWLDDRTGHLVQFYGPTGQAAGNTVTAWLYALHFGAVFGLPYRLVVSATGIVAAGLSVTGVWIWWRKRQRRVTVREGQRSRQVS